MNRAVHGSEKIITVTQATKDELLKHFHVDAKKIVVTYEGVDLQLLAKKQPALVTKPYFLFVGNVYPHKNAAALLKAYSRILNQFPSLLFVFAGKEDYFYQQIKEKIAKLGISSSILFYRSPSDEQLSNLYKNAIALVSTSFMEGFGLPCLEAMANGTAVVASDIASYREVLGSVPLYFDPGDVNSLTRRLEEAITQGKEGLSERISSGVQRAKQYTWEKTAKETIDVYERSARLR